MNRHFVSVALLPLRYGNQVMLDLGLRQRPEEDRWTRTQLKKTLHHKCLALINGMKHFYLNLGFSLVTTATSNSVGLKSVLRTEDRQDIAN